MSDQWRILIVEDDEEVSQNIVTSLRKDGYQVQGVVGSAAIRVLWSEDYDVVISDLRTPGAEGFDLLEWVRAYRPNLRMIMFGPQEMRSQSLERGAVGFVLAPVDLHELKEELRRLLQQTGFSASLDSFDLLDVIQIITMSRKDIALLINTGLEERGTLGFKTGDLIWADYGVLRGEEAFFALAAHKNGTVIYQPWNAQIRPNVTQPLSRLIFQALQYRSKYALAIPQTGEQPSVKASDASGLSLLDVDDDDSPFLVLQDGEEAPPVQQDGEVDVMLTEKTGQAREWWEGTGRIAAINVNSPDKNTRDLNPRRISARLAPLPADEVPDLDELPNPTNTRLPSWVTDQPTMAHFPAVNLESAATSAASQSETTWGQEDFYKESAPPPPFEAAEDWKPVSLGTQPDVEPEQSDFPDSLEALSGNGPQASLLPDGLPMPLPTTDEAAAQTSNSSDTDVGDTAKSVSMQSGHLQSLNTPPRATGSLTHDSGKLLARRLIKGRIIPGQATNDASPTEWDISQRPRMGRADSGQFPLDRINPQSPSDRGENGLLPIRRLGTPRRTDEPSFPSITNRKNTDTSQMKSLPGPAIPPTPATPPSSPEPPAWETPAPPFTWEYEPENEPTANINPLQDSLPGYFPGVGAQTGSGAQSLLPQSSVAGTPTPTFRRDYPTMVSALQSLGYSVPGFVATALATLDGQPIAQVAVGDLDISGLCKHFSRMLRSALLVLDAALWGAFQQQVIVSTERAIILKSIREDHQVFLILVTKATTKTNEALEAIEKVEDTLRKAL